MNFLFKKNKIVSFANEEIVEKAIILLKDIYIHLGPQLKLEQVIFFKIKLLGLFEINLLNLNYLRVQSTLI